MSSIKVPKHLRERVSRTASQRGLTAASLITALIDDYECQERFDAVRRAYEAVDTTYLSETDDWGSLAGDGLET